MYHALGDLERAEVEYERCRRLRPEHELLKDNMDRLRRASASAASNQSFVGGRAMGMQKKNL